MRSRQVTALIFVFVASAFAQDDKTSSPQIPPDQNTPSQSGPSREIQLTVPAGVPLRLYLTKRVAKRAGAPVEAKLLTPVYAFDREVIPAGSTALGQVSRVQPVSRWQRASAILGGDFTPLRVEQVEFTSVVLPDGRRMPVHTTASSGLNSLVPLRPPKQRNPSPQGGNGGVLETGKQKVKEQVNAQIDRIKSIPDLVRGPSKKEWLIDFLMAKLPYHPQYVRSRTRFDAELAAPLDFGSATVTPESVQLLGSQPAAGSVAHARLVTALDSASSKQGEGVEAVLDQPLFSAGNQLVLPEGTHIRGSVVLAKRARWFHRAGRLRFNFQNVEVPQVAQWEAPPPATASVQTREERTDAPAAAPEKQLQLRTQGSLTAAESGNAPLQVDSEGGVQAKESKTRFIGTAVAILMTRSATDNDVRRSSSGTITSQNSGVGRRALGGGLGLGLFGSIAAQRSRNFGVTLAYYGLAWSVYSTVVARGAEVQFNRNAVVDIGFNPRSPAGVSTPTSEAKSKGDVEPPGATAAKNN